jgi:two-component system, NtrC family, nitrogen regulation sensor histidine kinase NtrY
MAKSKKRTLSLAVKLQLVMLSLLLLVFAVIAWQTVTNVESEYAKYHEMRLLRKATTINSHIEYVLDEADDIVQIDWDHEVKKISEINRINMILLNESYEVIAFSSDSNLINNIVVPKYLESSKHGESRIEHRMLNNQDYLASYSKIELDEVVIIVEVPYFNSGKDSSSEIKSLITQLVKIYFIFFLVILLIAPFIVNKLLSTLNVVRQKMNKLEIGGKNEKIETYSNDDLGALVREYNRMIDELEESANQLKQQERENAWKEIAQQVAHEIKNPLTPMKLSIQHLLRAKDDDPAKFDMMVERVSKTLVEQIDHLAYIASEFSSFARIPAPKFEALNINAEISQVVELYKEYENIVLTFEGDESLSANLDKSQFNRVMCNIVKNAIQAVEDVNAPAIKIKAFAEGTHAIIEVKDNGVGIALDVKHNIFTPNFSTKSSGMGIGLAMCKRIIEGFKGEVRFESKMNEGTTFYIKLPQL